MVARRGPRPGRQPDRRRRLLPRGTADALLSGAPDAEAVRRGMAVAAAAVQHPSGGMLDAALVAPALAALPEAVPA